MTDSRGSGAFTVGTLMTVVVSLLAYGLLLWLAGRYDAGALETLGFGRAGAVERARALGPALGVPSEDWRARAAAQLDRQSALYLAWRRATQEKASAAIPPGASGTTWRVHLTEQDGIRELAVELDAQGRPRSLSLTPQPASLRRDLTDAELAAAAGRGLSLLVGDLAQRFEVEEEGRLQTVIPAADGEEEVAAPAEAPEATLPAAPAAPEEPAASEPGFQAKVDGKEATVSFSLPGLGGRGSQAAAPPEPPEAPQAPQRVEIRHWKWRWQPAESPGVLHTAALAVRGQRLNDLEWQTEVDLAAAGLPGTGPGELGGPSSPQLLSQLRSLRLPLVLLALLIYLAQVQRHLFPHRRVFVVAGFALLASFVWVHLTFGQRLLGEDGGVAVWLGSMMSPVLRDACFALAVFGAGYATALRLCPRPMEGAELLLRGRWRSRRVGRALRDGVLAAGVVACLPYVLAAASGGRLVPSAVWPEILAARWPALALLSRGFHLPLLAYLAALLPLVYAVVPWRPAARTLAVLLGGLLLAIFAPIHGSLTGLWLVGTLLALVFDQLYHRRGLLTAMVAGGGAAVASAAAVLVAQPPWRLSGLVALGLLAALGLVGQRIAARGRDEALTAEEMEVRRRIQAERERMKAQLSVAREAQMRMLPAAPPNLPGYDIAASCRPALYVGGDLYEFLFLDGPEGRPRDGGPGLLGIALGDVSGKGMVASLYMTLTKGLMLAAAERCQKPRAMLSEVNRGLYQETRRNIFVTLWYGVLDPATGILRHVRAGHNPALWRRHRLRKTVALRPRGFALGGTSSRTFDRLLVTEEIQLEPGDGLFIYSDGLPEAMNLEREEYGDARLAEAVARTDGLPAAQALGAIFADVNAFIGEAPQHDDMTLIVLRVAAG